MVQDFLHQQYHPGAARISAQRRKVLAEMVLRPASDVVLIESLGGYPKAVRTNYMRHVGPKTIL